MWRLSTGGGNVTLMKPTAFPVLALLLVVPTAAVLAQNSSGNSDHQAMLDLLNITSPLRPGAAGRLDADGNAPPNYANYDESKARAASPVPALLIMADGREIETPAQWEQRRRELLEIFDREFYGR